MILSLKKTDSAPDFYARGISRETGSRKITCLSLTKVLLIVGQIIFPPVSDCEQIVFSRVKKIRTANTEEEAGKIFSPKTTQRGTSDVHELKQHKP